MELLIAGAVAALVLFFGKPPAAAPEEVTVLPGPDGRTGTVVVQREGAQHTLNQPFATSRAGEAQVVQRSEAEVRGAYGSVLAALPARPSNFLLYFVSGKDELTDDSRAQLNQVLVELKRRAVPDVAVTAHTDSVGAHDANDKLSLQRAERVKGFLVGIGIPADRIQAVGRGKRELLVPTADNVDEPRNRRVEITVR